METLVTLRTPITSLSILTSLKVTHSGFLFIDCHCINQHHCTKIPLFLYLYIWRKFYSPILCSTFDIKTIGSTHHYILLHILFVLWFLLGSRGCVVISESTHCTTIYLIYWFLSMYILRLLFYTYYLLLLLRGPLTAVSLLWVLSAGV